MKLGLRIWSQDLNQVTQVKRKVARDRDPGTSGSKEWPGGRRKTSR